MKQFRQYLFPALLCLAVFCAFFLLSAVPSSKRPRKMRDEKPVVVGFPHGRVLYVVVEEEGAYLGEEFVPIELFENKIEKEYRYKEISYVFLLGTDSARYGSVVTAYTALLKQLDVPTEIFTINVKSGTRRGPIEVYERAWDYYLWHEDEPELEEKKAGS